MADFSSKFWVPYQRYIWKESKGDKQGRNIRSQTTDMSMWIQIGRCIYCKGKNAHINLQPFLISVSLLSYLLFWGIKIKGSHQERNFFDWNDGSYLPGGHGVNVWTATKDQQIKKNPRQQRNMNLTDKILVFIWHYVVLFNNQNSEEFIGANLKAWQRNIQDYQNGNRRLPLIKTNNTQYSSVMKSLLYSFSLLLSEKAWFHLPPAMG